MSIASVALRIALVPFVTCYDAEPVGAVESGCLEWFLPCGPDSFGSSSSSTRRNHKRRSCCADSFICIYWKFSWAWLAGPPCLAKVRLFQLDPSVQTRAVVAVCHTKSIVNVPVKCKWVLTSLGRQCAHGHRCEKQPPSTNCSETPPGSMRVVLLWWGLRC